MAKLYVQRGRRIGVGWRSRASRHMSVSNMPIRVDQYPLERLGATRIPAEALLVPQRRHTHVGAAIQEVGCQVPRAQGTYDIPIHADGTTVPGDVATS